MSTISFFEYYPVKLRPLFETEFKARKIPKAYTVSFEHFAQGGEKYCIYLDIEKSGLILRLNYEAPQEDYFNNAFLEILSRKISGLPIEEALHISNLDLLHFLEEETENEKGELWDIFLQLCGELLPLEFPLLPVPLFLLQNAISEYHGRTTVWQEENILNSDLINNDYLICRCFGLNYMAIASYLKENANLSLGDITDKNNAGGGCTSCIEDIEEGILKWREELGIMPEVDWKTYTILGQTQAQWLLILHQIIEQYKKEKQLTDEDGHWGIASLKGHALTLKGQFPVHLQENLQQYIKEKSQVLFHLSFLF